MVTRIHHINFVVHDLDEAEERYRRMLGLSAGVREALPGRGVNTARFDLGGSWLVLVQPLGDEGEPARHLRERGEGFFLLSFAVDDLETAMAEAEQRGAHFSAAGAREGIQGWRIVDFDQRDTLGAILQLTEGA